MNINEKEGDDIESERIYKEMENNHPELYVKVQRWVDSEYRWMERVANDPDSIW